MKTLDWLYSQAIAPQFLRFALVGGSGVVVGLLALNAAMRAFDQFLIANAVSFIIAVTWNFTLNRWITFTRTGKPVLYQWGEFALGCLGGALASWVVSLPLYHGIPFFKEHYNVAALAGVAASAFVNFTWSRCVVFRTSKHAYTGQEYGTDTWTQQATIKTT